MIAWVRMKASNQFSKLITTDLQHRLCLLNYDGKLFICLMDKDKQIHCVLDVGTGTGIWGIDFGEQRGPEIERRRTC